MYPTLHLAGIDIPVFAICIALGVNASCVLVALGVPPARRAAALWRWMLFLGAFALGGRLGHQVLFATGGFDVALAGGNSILGSIALGIVYIGVEARLAGEGWRRLADGRVLPLLALQVVGKIGCFLAGCCYGTPSGLPWSVVPIARGASRGVALHPVQLYEAAFYVVLGLALWANRRRLAAGGMAWIYLAGYGSIRFVAEYFRGDVVPWRPGLTVGQGAAILLLLAGLVVAAGGRGRERVHPQ